MQLDSCWRLHNYPTNYNSLLGLSFMDYYTYYFTALHNGNGFPWNITEEE